MAYGKFALRTKSPKFKPGSSCKDFKPCFFNRRLCKLRKRCDNAGDKSIYTHWLKSCDGVLYDNY